MSDFKIPTWFKYSIALVLVVLLGAISEIPDLELPSPQDAGWSPLIGLVHSVVVGAAFSLIVITATVWSRRRQEGLRERIARLGILAFALFAVSDFALEVLARPFFSGLSGRPGLQNALVWLVQAGRGLLLPLVLLTVFLAVILFRRHRSH